MSRRVAREAAFKALFQVDIGKCEPDPSLRQAVEGSGITTNSEQFLAELLTGTLDKLDELDDMIEKYLVKWEFKRLPAVVRNLLRLALYEINYRQDIPSAVSINEALELAKTYGCGSELLSFMNGLLDKIAGAVRARSK